MRPPVLAETIEPEVAQKWADDGEHVVESERNEKVRVLGRVLISEDRWATIDMVVEAHSSAHAAFLAINNARWDQQGAVGGWGPLQVSRWPSGWETNVRYEPYPHPVLADVTVTRGVD